MNIKTKSVLLIAMAVSLVGFAGGAMAANENLGQNVVKPQSAAVGISTSTMTAAERRIQIINNFVSNMANRFNVNINILDSLSARIASRIGKLDQAGKDTTQAKVKLAEANSKIQEAKDALAKMQQDVNVAISNVQPKKAFELVRTKSIKPVMDKIKEAHKALVDTIVILVKVNAVSQTATSTSTTPVVTTSTINQ